LITGSRIVPRIELTHEGRLTVSTNPNIIGKGSKGIVLVLVKRDLGTIEDPKAMFGKLSLEEHIALSLAIGLPWDDVRTCVSITDSQDPNDIAVGFVLSTLPHSDRGQ
jgi:hypothetical protein